MSVTPDQSAQAPPTVTAQVATPIPTTATGAALSSTDIAKLVAEQLATQFQAQFASFRAQNSATLNEEDVDTHILATDW